MTAVPRPADRPGDVLDPLVRLFGWSHAHDARTGHVTVDSPCHSLFVDVDPTGRDGICWRISHHEPYWEAQLSRQTPAGAVAALTQALPHFLGDTRNRFPVTTNTLVQTAALHRWTMTADGPTTVFTSADGHDILTHNADADTRWHIRHARSDRSHSDWTAMFTRATPTRLVTHFLAHLADTRPAEHATGGLASRAQNHRGTPTAPVPDTPAPTRPRR
ncbi:protein of unknown function DUF317 [Actinobacteria bacterium OK074]|nr:protein of unknown function DUF317 [Actinobacteria bacterium OK074]